MAALHLCVEMRLNVTDGRKVCMSHKEDTVITSLKPPSLLFVLSAPSALLDVVFVSAFIQLHSSSWTEQREEPWAGSPLVTVRLHNVKIQPDIIAPCWMCFIKPLCKFLSSSAVNHNERAYSHNIQGPSQCNEMMRETPVQDIGYSQSLSLWGLFSIVFHFLYMQLNIKRERNIHSKHLDDSASVLLVNVRGRSHIHCHLRKQRVADVWCYWQEDKYGVKACSVFPAIGK